MRFRMLSLLLTLTLLLVTLAPLFATGQSEAPPLGSETNPIIWSFVPSGEMERVASGARQVADLLFAKTGLHFSTNVATEYAGVIEALSANPPKAHMSSLATFAYVLAADRKVSQAALVSVRNGQPTYNGQIVAGADTGIKSLADLKGKTFARVDPLSTSGWIIPMLTIRAAGVDPDRDMKVLDAGSHDAAVAAVYNGQADAGACYVDARTRIEKQYPDVMEKVAIVAVTEKIPNDGVQFSPAVPAEIREKIVQAMLDIIATEEGKKAFNTAYQWTGLQRADDSFYDPFRQVLQASGMQVEQLLKK